VSPLSRELIIKLAKENDSELLREVLNYYAFLKNKKEQEARKQWESIEEVQPDKEEIEIINEFEKNREKFEFVSMEEVLKELGLMNQNYKINISKNALKFINKQDNYQRKRILSAIYGLPKGDVKKLKAMSIIDLELRISESFLLRMIKNS